MPSQLGLNYCVSQILKIGQKKQVDNAEEMLFSKEKW